MMTKLYKIYVKKEASYYVKAESEEEALNIADEWLNERDFDDYEIEESD